MNSRIFTSILRLITLLSLLITPLLAGPGSLWQQRGIRDSMYSDKTAAGIGDILTIVVEERAEITASKSSSTNKESAVADQLSRFLYPATGDLPGMQWDSGNDFSGGGEISNSQSASSNISVLVIDRLPNGNLAVEGMRQVTLANEINYAILRGYVRPHDISAANTVLSSRVADAKIEFVAEGALTEAQRQGWLNRVYQFVNPF